MAVDDISCPPDEEYEMRRAAKVLFGKSYFSVLSLIIDSFVRLLTFLDSSTLILMIWTTTITSGRSSR